MTSRDEFQNAWKSYESRLERSVKLNTILLESKGTSAAHDSLRSLKTQLWIEIVSNAIALLLLGSFIAGVLGDARYAGAGALLFAAAWLALVAVIRQIVALTRGTGDEPVVAFQMRLERLRLERARAIFWTFAISPLLWVALLIVASRVLSIDVFAAFPMWLAANGAFAVIVLAVAVVFARRFPAGSSPLADALAGRSIAGALSNLREIRRFADELLE